MTTGAVIFAINNGSIDYEAMARWSAQNIQRHLGIPTHIITRDLVNVAGQDRWFEDIGGTVIWHNESRIDAYELSPWDRTLVLDADYVVASDQLRVLLDADQDFLAHRRAYDVTGVSDFRDQNHFGTYRMPMWWATVMMFRRSRTAELIFGSMQMIRKNWTHYRQIYHNHKNTYRNDHALSIALGMVNGHVMDHAAIPWNLASLLPAHRLTQLSPDQYRVEFTHHDQQHWINLRSQDFHAMGKSHLGDIVANNS
jgi:hypothetical protein